jgi:hypothetical protein
MERTVKIARTPEERARFEKHLEDWDNREPIPALPGEDVGSHLERIAIAKGSKMDRKVIEHEPQVIEHEPETKAMIQGRRV